MGIATIATAVLGATLVIAGLTQQGSQEQGSSESLKAVFTLLAAALYLITLQNLGKVIFPDPRRDRKTRLEHRRRWASAMFATFVALAMTTTLVVLVATYQSFQGQSEANQVESDVTQDCPVTQMDSANCPMPSAPGD